MHPRFVSVYILVFMFGGAVSAAEVSQSYRGVRSLGMGGAAVATVNDETSLLVNPAGLGKLRDYYLTIFDPELEMGADTPKVAGGDVFNLRNPQKALTKGLATPDKNMHEKVQAFPSLVVPNFGFGVYGKYQVDARMDSATNLFSYNYTNDYAAVFGLDFRFWNGIIKIGANVRAIDRTEVRRDDIDPTSTDLSLGALSSEGLGVASDAGILLTAPVQYLPTLGAVVRDLGRTSYTYRGGMFSKTTDVPNSTPQTVDVAVALNPILGNRLRSTWTLQYSDATNSAKETDVLRRAHGGFELNYADALFLRGGVNQRYWTAGVELAIVNYQFQAASYGEDIGVDGHPLEDRRYVVKFAFRF